MGEYEVSERKGLPEKVSVKTNFGSFLSGRCSQQWAGP